MVAAAEAGKGRAGAGPASCFAQLQRRNCEQQRPFQVGPGRAVKLIQGDSAIDDAALGGARGVVSTVRRALRIAAPEEGGMLERLGCSSGVRSSRVAGARKRQRTSYVRGFFCRTTPPPPV